MRPTGIIADDDELSRDRFRDLLEEVPLVELIGEAGDGGSALALIDELKPDIVFLDIQMPVMTGLEVASRITHAPVIIFTTAFDQYAITAFEMAAVDYLLKPFGTDRLREALQRAVQAVGAANAASAEALPTAQDRLAALQDPDGSGRVFLRDRDMIVPVRIPEIHYCEADGDYVRVYTSDRSFLVRVRLGDLEDRLGARFLRIHRSHLVNLDEVETFETHDDSRLAAVLRGGQRLVVSRARSIELRRRST